MLDLKIPRAPAAGPLLPPVLQGPEGSVGNGCGGEVSDFLCCLSIEYHLPKGMQDGAIEVVFCYRSLLSEFVG